jgi:hypothetical protein
MKLFAKRGTCFAHDHHFEVPICSLTCSSAYTDIGSDAGDHDVFYTPILQALLKIGRRKSTSRHLIEHDFVRQRLQCLINFPAGIADGRPESASEYSSQCHRAEQAANRCHLLRRCRRHKGDRRTLAKCARTLDAGNDDLPIRRDILNKP